MRLEPEQVLTMEDHQLLDYEEKVVTSQAEEARIQEETDDLILERP